MSPEELQAAIWAEREARIRAEGERDGFAKALAIIAQNSSKDAAAERRRAKDREAKAVARRQKSADSSDTPPPLDGSPLPSAPSLPSPLSSPPTALSAPTDQSAVGPVDDPRQVVMFSVAARPAAVESPAAAPKPTPPIERPEDLQALWNAEAHPALPRWKELTDTRRRKAAARLRDRPLAEWREIIRRISASAFCRGEDGKGWKASPDWLLQSDTATKVLEGKYLRPGESPQELQPDRPKPKVITM